MCKPTESFWERLKGKWRELPFGDLNARKFSTDLLDEQEWPDDKLMEHWENAFASAWPRARWFLELYQDQFCGRYLCDVGPGIGLDGIWWVEHGAYITFVDIVEDNLRLLKRICELRGVEAEYVFMGDPVRPPFGAPVGPPPEEFPVWDARFDAFTFIGSLHHTPFELMQPEIEALMKWLVPGGTVAVLAYPKERWAALGSLPFEEFGKRTDGERTPWAEWYDDEKIQALFGPGFQLNWSKNFNHDKFNWFDLTKVT